uniref:Uncharacterized protein n=1 Tax=Anopheles darlingi TaxID=43151 RepID=A0A2M4CPA9_ANODA
MNNNSSSRTHLPWMFNNSLAIRQEIQRFESVHPSIYAIYHLIDLIPDGQVAQQIRDHVVCIEGQEQLTLDSDVRVVTFANSAEKQLDEEPRTNHTHDTPLAQMAPVGVSHRKNAQLDSLHPTIVPRTRICVNCIGNQIQVVSLATRHSPHVPSVARCEKGERRAHARQRVLGGLTRAPGAPSIC